MNLSDPIDFASDYYDRMALLEFRENIILEKMHDYKSQALDKLRSIVHPDYLEDFAKLLSYAEFDESPHAKSLADKLNLNKLHFLAIDECKNEFEEELLNYGN